MYFKKRISKTVLMVCMFLGFWRSSSAQFSLAGQIRTRAELRDGQGAPLPSEASPAIFISQRTRLTLNYAMYRLKFGVTAQDVRVWGQDVSTINRTTTQDNNALMLHEAWAEVLLTDTSLKEKSFSVKFGRQELSYDDERLLGKLDWLQQGRRHDAVLFKYETNQFLIHTAFAFNQNKENASGTVYNSTPPGNYTASTNGGAMYKSMEMLYAGKKISRGNTSFLFFADQFNKYYSDSQSAKIFESGVFARFTAGFYFNDVFNGIGVTTSAYYQFGKNQVGQNLNAYLLTGNLQYFITKKYSVGAGLDYYSGGTHGTTSNAFDPLYGTPHKFAGLMDYFYAANRFGNGGLADYFIKTKFQPSGKFQLSADLHQFNSAADITGASQKDFGQELDVVANYNVTRFISFESGYGHYFGTPLIATVKNVANADLNSNWTYVQVNIKPEFFSAK